MNVLIEKLLAVRDDVQAQNLSRFFKTSPGQYGEGDCFLGVKVPVTRSIVKEVWSDCSFSDLEECLSSKWHEVRLAALLVLVQKFKKARIEADRQEYVDFYLSHLDAVNNWDLVDLSCYEILGTWLLDKDATLLYDLARNGKTVWEQRIGIVSTMQFLRHGRIDDTYAIADILLHHPHDLIQKAVGWLLREAGKRDIDRLKRYLLSPDPSTPTVGRARCLVMPRTMLRYSVEKFPETERQYFIHFKDK